MLSNSEGSVAETPKRQISLFGAIVIIVGFVVGASIFILVGPLAGSVGPGLPFAYLLAAVPAVFACLYNIQLAGTLPTTGANYVAGTRFISPFFGFVTTWMVLVGAVFGVPLLAVGFAAYLNELLPGTPQTLTAIVIVVVLGIVNLFGIRFATIAQAIFVVLFVVALGLYIFGGISHIDSSQYHPLFPNGTSALILGAIAAYYSFTGFTVITELSGEVRNARRNVPLAIIISFFVILLIYIGTTAVLTGTIGWQTAGDSPAAVADSAATFLPDGAVTFINLGALFASATTINAVLTSLSRDVLQLGKDNVFPRALGVVHPRFGSPQRAVALLALLSVIGVLLAFSIEKYALLTVFAFLVIALITSAAVMRIPKVRPDLWAMSPFQFSTFWRWFSFVGMVVMALSIIGYATYSDPATGVLFLVIAALAVPYWILRKRALHRHGLDLDASMRAFTADMSAELGIDHSNAAVHGKTTSSNVEDEEK